jgi:hypothetical protein
MRDLPKTHKEKIAKKYGLSVHETPLFDIAPSLNLDSFFPSDPCHSEYAGITKLAHQILLGSILSPRGQEQYTEELRRFPFPFGWGRLQSPTHHLDSYQLQEHARASIIIPLLLRSCLRKDWIVPFYLSSLKKIIPDVCPIDYIVRVFARIAKNNTVLLSRKISASDCKQLPQIIRNARHGLQRLLEAAAEMPPQSRTQPQSSKKTREFRNMMRRPNMHIGVHYPRQAEEYGVTNNSMVLAGESKHRYETIYSFFQSHFAS